MSPVPQRALAHETDGSSRFLRRCHQRTNRIEDNLELGVVLAFQLLELSSQFGIRGIPTLILFKGGKVHAQKVGALSKSQLAAFVDSNL